MSSFRSVLGAVLLSALSAPALARENPYDVVGKVLAPYTQVLAASAKTRNRALSLKLHVEPAEGSDPQAADATVQLALEMPDRLRLTAPLGQEPVTVCRDGRKIWAFPGSRVQALLADPEVAKTLPPPDRHFKLAPFELPIPEKQLAFLPVLFQVQDAGEESVGGQRCRVLDLQLQKELAKSLAFDQPRARIWVGDDYRLVRVAARSEQGGTTVRIDETTFAPALPPETWHPSAEQSADVLVLSPMLYDQLVRGLMGRAREEKAKNERKK